MVAIGILDIPPEIQLQIAQFVETKQALKALSVISRSLRRIAQSVLFEKLRIDLGKELRGSIDDLLANPQICASIRWLGLRGRFLLSTKPEEETLSLIKSILPKMVGLREVWIYQVNLSKVFLDAFLEIATSIPLQVNLGRNIYPPYISPSPNTPLQITHLHVAAAVDHPSLEFYRSVFRASSATLTGLNVRADEDGLMKLADINLPLLHDLTLFITTENEVSRTSAAAFIAAQRTIRKLDLRGKVHPLPPLPPDALPDLRELNASTKLVNQLVPGRPVEAIEVSSSQPRDQDWFGDEVTRSTVRVRKLRVQLNTPILDTRLVKRMVAILPFLEILWLSVFDDVSRPFARLSWLIRLQVLLNVAEVLTSLKCLNTLRISLFHRETWVNHDVNGIATKLRNANSSFSFLEIREGGASGWKNTVFIWNEVLGVFHHMESVSGL
jgi:hypothetical protein